MIEQAISDFICQDDPCILLSRGELAACAYLEAQDVQEAQSAYEHLVYLARSVPGMKSLENIFDKNAKILSTWGNKPRKWSELLAEWQGHIPERQNEKSIATVAIISNYPEHAVGSLIADMLETRGVDASLFYIETLTNFDKLPTSWGILVLGGHLTPGIEGLMSPVIHAEEYAQMAVMERNPPAFGVMAFDVSSRPGVWIGGMTPRETVSAVRHWLETGGVQRFVERLQ